MLTQSVKCAELRLSVEAFLKLKKFFHPCSSSRCNKTFTHYYISTGQFIRLLRYLVNIYLSSLIHAAMQRAITSRTRASLLPSVSPYNASPKLRPIGVTSLNFQQQRFSHKVSRFCPLCGDWYLIWYSRTSNLV